jgi:hypothetical protein
MNHGRQAFAVLSYHCLIPEATNNTTRSLTRLLAITIACGQDWNGASYYNLKSVLLDVPVLYHHGEIPIVSHTMLTRKSLLR